MKNILHTIESILGIYRWHPKIALRYLPVVDDIKKNFSEYSSVLEVGSGGLGITPYLKKKIVGVDVCFDLPVDKNITAVTALANELPFADKAFDTVICLDVIEHNSNHNRIKIISELLRVASSKIYIGLPVGKLSQKQDEEISVDFFKKHDHNYEYLSQHLEYGLPEKDWIIKTVTEEAQKLNKSVQIKIYGNINLKFRKFLMSGWISDNIIVNILFRKIFILFIPIFRIFNHSPTYRELFFITIN